MRKRKHWLNIGVARSMANWESRRARA